MIHSTFVDRDKSEKHLIEWSKACSNFRAKYQQLCFWNGIEDYRAEIRSGNNEAIEYYICFIEVRPYFFRSGYIFNDLMRVLKNAELTKDQRIRYEIINTNYAIYKENRKLKS